MSPENETLRLPSGVIAVRHRRSIADGFAYSIHGAPAILLPADVEALYADSIAGDGGRELPAPPPPPEHGHANKRKYRTLADAQKAASYYTGDTLAIVACTYCGGYHLATGNPADLVWP